VSRKILYVTLEIIEDIQSGSYGTTSARYHLDPLGRYVTVFRRRACKHGVLTSWLGMFTTDVTTSITKEGPFSTGT
jgi:hypothetical protein